MNRLRPIPTAPWSVAGWGPLLLVLAMPGDLEAQERIGRFEAARVDAAGVEVAAYATPPARARAADEAEVATRAVAGVIGSAVGLGLGAAIGGLDVWGCQGDALGCQLLLGGIGGAAGSVTGTVLGVRLVGALHDSAVNTPATITAAGFGALAGVLVGFGMKAATGSDAGLVVGFSLTQGILAGMASVQE